jgi:predicted  nucleic acid-binding Zn-ribbon protein
MQLKLLWELQKMDLTIASMRRTIEEAPGNSGIDQNSENLTLLKDKLSALQITFKEDRKKQRDLEMKIQKIVDDRKELYDGMYSGKTSAKELEQMQKKMEMLSEEKKKLEDQLITLMESVEELEDSISTINNEVKEADLELHKKQKKLEAELAQYNEELAALESIREKKAVDIEPQFLQRYEVLAAKHGGQALALVENNICGGCRVFISSGLYGRLYKQDALVYCENCGRLLFKLEDPQ